MYLKRLIVLKACLLADGFLESDWMRALIRGCSQNVMALLQHEGNCREWGALEETDHGGGVLGYSILSLALLLALHLALLLRHHEESSFAPPQPSAMTHCVSTGPERMEPANHGLKFLES